MPDPALHISTRLFPGKLSEFRKREHDDRVDTKTVEAKAEIEVNGARAADEKKLGALDHRLALGNEAAVKRIEAGTSAVKANGHSKQDGNSWTYFNENGKRQYTTDLPLVQAYGQCIVCGEHVNTELDNLELLGVTFDDFDAALGGETGVDGKRVKSRDEVMGTEGHT